MSWSKGAHIFSEIAEVIYENVSDDLLRKIIYMDLIEIFDAANCDNLNECTNLDPMLDSALVEMDIISMEDPEVEEDEFEEDLED
jgi:hypothetical protein